MRKVREQEPEGFADKCRLCDEPVRSLDLCSAHYYRHNKYGDPLFKRRPRASPARDWFMRAMEYDGDECQLWPFVVSKDGYARVTIEGRFVFASRYACELANGPPPTDKHQAAHTCRNGRNGCINKRHVEWKTPAGNIADKWRDGTMLVGSKHHQAKLTESDVMEIRGLAGSVTRKSLAEMFSVGVSTVDNVIDRATWRHI